MVQLTGDRRVHGSLKAIERQVCFLLRSLSVCRQILYQCDLKQNQNLRHCQL